MSRLDSTLHAMFPAADPTPTDLELIEQAYRRRISADVATSRRRLVVPVAAVAALITAIGIVALQPTPVQAALTEIAQAAQTIDIAELSDGDFYYTESTSTSRRTINLEDGIRITYTIDELRRVWISRTGREAVIQTTRTNPNFQTEDDQALYFKHGLDTADALDTTQTTAVENSSHAAFEQDWPTDGGGLLRAVRELPSVNTDTQVAAQLLNLITESPASPDLRAATIEALSRLDLDLIERAADTIHLRTRPTDLDNQILEFSLDNQGQLRHRTVITHDPAAPGAGFVVFAVDYTPTRIVDGP